MALISEDEKRRRRQSSESVLGTHAMEGLFPDEPTRSLLRRYDEGELSLDQFSEAMDRHAHALLAASGKMADVA